MAHDLSCEPLMSSRPTHVTCHDCSLSRLCLPLTLDEEEIRRLEGIIKRNRPLHRQDYLIRAGTVVENIYALRSGAMKTYMLAQEGVEQITSFHLPGELIGLDAIGESLYPTYTVALETSQVCAIPVNRLEELAGLIAGLRKQLLHTLSKEIQADHERLSHVRDSAEQRLAAFLLNLSARYSKRGLSASNFILPMNRRDIGNYLGLSMETVSRLFTHFRDTHLVDSSGRELHIPDLKALHRQCHPCEEGPL